jgi:hypothetical protein
MLRLDSTTNKSARGAHRRELSGAAVSHGAMPGSNWMVVCGQARLLHMNFGFLGVLGGSAVQDTGL